MGTIRKSLVDSIRFNKVETMLDEWIKKIKGDALLFH